jgi:hypothetical protein
MVYRPLSGDRHSHTVIRQIKRVKELVGITHFNCVSAT